MGHWTGCVDFKKISRTAQNGFEGFVTVDNLCRSGFDSVPATMGVYLILAPDAAKPVFNPAPSGFIKNRVTPRSVEYLQTRWNSDTLVIYIGKAGGTKCRRSTSLRSRLREYMKWKSGDTNRHHGGRDIWQIEKPENLLVAWRTIANDEPRACERKLLLKFKSEFHRLPFANHKM